MSLERLARGVWRVGSGRPRVAVLGGIHGNERTGVEVVRQLVERLSSPSLAAQVCGELTLTLGNPDAIDRDVRFVEVDLNRCFGAVEEGGALMEEARARELAPLMRGLDVMVDLHATNKPSEPFARLPGSLSGAYFRRCEQLFLSRLPPQCRTVLWDPKLLIAGGAMTDEFCLRHAPGEGEGEGGAYVCYEAGLASDVSLVDSTAAAVDGLLAEVGLLGGAPGAAPPRDWTHYEIFERFDLDDRGFMWLDSHGQANFQAVPAGAAYGQRGPDGPLLTAPEDAFMVFPKVEHLWSVGRPLGWLARQIPCPP